MDEPALIAGLEAVNASLDHLVTGKGEQAEAGLVGSRKLS